MTIQQQYEAVVQQNRDLQGKLRVANRVIELMASGLSTFINNIHVTLTQVVDFKGQANSDFWVDYYKNKAIAELDQLTGSEG